VHVYEHMLQLYPDERRQKNIIKLHLEKRYRKMHHKDVRNGLTKSLANLDTRSNIKKSEYQAMQHT
jgi:hypothetical protein